jgi:hypothetical protein
MPMTNPALLSALADAIRNAGATEEIIAALLAAGGANSNAPRSKGGRPRKHVDRAAKDRAYRERKKARVETCDEIDLADRRAPERRIVGCCARVASGQAAAPARSPPWQRWSMLLKKSLSTADQNFSRPLMRFSDKNVRDLVS